MEGPMLQIGATHETIEAARRLIIEIVNSQNADKTKIQALKAAAHICESHNNTITGCTFNSADALAMKELRKEIQSEFAKLSEIICKRYKK